MFWMIMPPRVLMKKARCYLAPGGSRTSSPPPSLSPWWGAKPLPLLLKGPKYSGGLALASLYCQSALEVWRGSRPVPAACWSVRPPSTLHGRLDFLHPARMSSYPSESMCVSAGLSVSVWPAVCPVCVLFVFPVYLCAGPASLSPSLTASLSLMSVCMLTLGASLSV